MLGAPASCAAASISATELVEEVPVTISSLIYAKADLWKKMPQSLEISVTGSERKGQILAPWAHRFF